MTARNAKWAEFECNVKAALEEAHQAAKAAYDSFRLKAKLTKEGHIYDDCGIASVVLYSPSYRLRETLKKLGEVQKGDHGEWHVSDFRKHVCSQSVTAQQRACQAACEVLERHFPGEGQFLAPSRVI